MTSAHDKVLEEPIKPKRVLPRAASGRRRRPGCPTRLRRQPGRQAEEPQGKERRPNPARHLWAKAQSAARSSQLLADAGHWDGAANRAYYAVFSAARAVLAGVRARLASSKGHGTIVRPLRKHLVQERGLDPVFGRSFFGG